MKKEKFFNETDKPLLRIARTVGKIILIFWGLTWLLAFVDDRGTLGDMFGTVNSLFSGAALAGIIFTILLQRKELELQRAELTATRDEFSMQNQTMKRQQFENLFFNMVSLHNQIVNDLDLSQGRINGRDALREYFISLQQDLKGKETLEDFEKSYRKFYELYQSNLGHYFRNLYRIFKLIEDTDFYDLGAKVKDGVVTTETFSDLNETEQYRYSCIVRAQLSDFEVGLLFYNGLSSFGEKFKPMIEKYRLLDHLPYNSIELKFLEDQYVDKPWMDA